MSETKGTCDDCGAPVLLRDSGTPTLPGLAFERKSGEPEIFVYHDLSACVRHLRRELESLKQKRSPR